jgi:hypothetical protein
MPKEVGAIMFEIQQGLSGALGVLQRKPDAEKKLVWEIGQLVLKKAGQYGIDTQRKSTIMVAEGVVEVEQIIAKFKKCGVAPHAKDIGELRTEMARIDAIYRLAESRGIKTEGKDLPTVLNALESAPKTTQPPIGNPFNRNNAKNNTTMHQGELFQRPRSMAEILKTTPETHDEAIIVLNALGIFLKVDDAKCLHPDASERDIRKVFHKLAYKIHPEAVRGKEHYMQLLSIAKGFLFSAGNGLA